MAESEVTEKLIENQKDLKDQIKMMTNQLEDYHDALQAYENNETQSKGMTEMQGAIFEMFKAFVKEGK